MKLVRIDRRVYESADKRFYVYGVPDQRTGSCYRVLDRRTDTNLRARTLKEVRETIRDMIANDRHLPTVSSYLHATGYAYGKPYKMPGRLEALDPNNHRHPGRDADGEPGNESE